MPDLIEIAYINKTHGIKGNLKVTPYIEWNTFKFLAAANLVLDSNSSILNLTTPDNQIINLHGVYTPEDAKKFCSIYLYSTKQHLKDVMLSLGKTPLDKGFNEQFFLFELISIKVLDDQGNEVGVVKDILDFSGDIHLEVVAPHRQSQMILLSNHLIKEINLSEEYLIIFS